jgi:hypothetical protein
MDVLGRVMAAYTKKSHLTNAQASIVRRENSIFIEELLRRRLPEMAPKVSTPPFDEI